MRLTALFIALSLLAACGEGDGVAGSDALSRHVKNNRVGSDADQWIEMMNMTGEWERVGLIFGYYGDNDECKKAIAGLKLENTAREYRCISAN
ncbi:hypothetical protein [Sphingosinicella rhizophila]|uniref:Lipoprotein n=1 Tax=Sphingosinicella rhizophila TaxID=3050082 RepID=A0ABU3Q9F8_9SPHN|nr:hypothetical protein [Sphingosinicella sp. GR2756]MDT9600044.1 hypothetical protein [Sphingosinicella sp. GR2756]